VQEDIVEDTVLNSDLNGQQKTLTWERCVALTTGYDWIKG